MPDFKFEVIDMVQEGNKVWVISRISDLLREIVKDSVDMME
jgi:hypothetical protein